MRAQTLTQRVLTLVLVAVGGAVLWAGQAGGTPSADASLAELVGEIRALRAAVERSSVVAARAQLVLGRVQLQESRLAVLGRQTQEARDRTGEAEAAQAKLAGQLNHIIRGLAGQAGQERDHEEALVAQLKTELKQAQARTEGLRAQEAAAGAALSDEQARWSDFNSRLEELERTLAAMAPPGR